MQRERERERENALRFWHQVSQGQRDTQCELCGCILNKPWSPLRLDMRRWVYLLLLHVQTGLRNLGITTEYSPSPYNVPYVTSIFFSSLIFYNSLLFPPPLTSRRQIDIIPNRAIRSLQSVYLSFDQ